MKSRFAIETKAKKKILMSHIIPIRRLEAEFFKVVMTGILKVTLGTPVEFC